MEAHHRPGKKPSHCSTGGVGMPRYSSARESSIYAGAGLPATHRARRDIGDVAGTRCAVGSLVIFARKPQIERPLLADFCLLREAENDPKRTVLTAVWN